MDTVTPSQNHAVATVQALHASGGNMLHTSSAAAAERHVAAAHVAARSQALHESAVACHAYDNLHANGAALCRAGVEVWAKELVSWHTREPCIVLPPNAQQGDAAVAAQAAAQAAQAAAPGAAAAGSSVRHERTVHMLHFLVDGVDGSLWENGLMVDAEPAPAGVTQPPLLKLNLTWAALHGLYGTKQQQQVDGTAEQDSAYQVGDAMQEMMAALGGG